MNFGEKVRQLRKNAGLTQPILAEKIGIEQYFLSRIENNKAAPAPETFIQICQLFDIKPYELLNGLNPETIRKQLAHIPAAQQTLRSKQAKNIHYNARYITISLVMIFGAFLFLLGDQQVIFYNSSYHYCLETKNSATNNSTCSTEILVSNTYLGQIYNRLTDNQTNQYFHLHDINHMIQKENKLLMLIGLTLVAIGTVNYFYDRKIKANI